MIEIKSWHMEHWDTLKLWLSASLFGLLGRCEARVSSMEYLASITDHSPWKFCWEMQKRNTWCFALKHLSLSFLSLCSFEAQQRRENPLRTVCKGKCICYMALTNIAFTTLIFPLFGDLNTWIKDTADRTTSLTTCSSPLTGRSAEQ